MRLAVWDVDGTLVDSRAIIFDCCTHALTRIGLPAPTYDAVRRIVGLSLEPALSILAPGLTSEEVVRVADGYKQRFHEHRAAPGFIEPLYAGAEETLRRLEAEGWRLAIATGKSRRGVEMIVQTHGWEDLFHSTHCADDGPGKPHPQMLLEAMRANRAGPDETIMIGDTAHDMRMARAAQVQAAGVSWGFNTAEELSAAGAHHVAESFSILNSQLDRFSNVLPAP
jgi:phosphoglycolate phosphatase